MSCFFRPLQMGRNYFIIECMPAITHLQLNIFQGKFLDRVVSYVKEVDADILHFQEVTGGKFSGGGEYTYPDYVLQKRAEANTQANLSYKGLNIFEEVKKRLNMEGFYAPRVQLKVDHRSFHANATFFKKSLPVLDHSIVWLKEFYEVEDAQNVNWRASGYNALAVQFEIGQKKLWTVNTHLAWGPTPVDENYKLEINMPLVTFMSELEKPWILSGDFNVDKNSRVVQELDKIGDNISEKNGFTNTLNEHIHPAKNLFPPGLAVDFTYTSPDIHVQSAELIEKDLSDHKGILTKIEL